MRFLPAAIAAFFVLTLAAVAQVTPVPVPVPVSNTVVEVPIGSWLADLQGYIVIAMGGVVGYFFRWLPARLQGIFMTMQAEQLMSKGMAFAVNTVIGGMKNAVWTIDIRNDVLRAFTVYVLSHGASSVKAFIGPASEIAEKGFARIQPPLSATGMPQPSPLPEGPAPNFITIGAEAQADATRKGMQSA